MNQIFELIAAVAKKLGRAIALLLLAFLLAFSLQPSAFGQVGTYVAPRINTVFNGWVTNTGSYTFYATNWLNPSGWHNVNWQISELGTNNIGTNQVPINIYGSAGSGNSYTNAAAGANFVYTANPLLVWPNNITATTTSYGGWTNLVQNLGDDWLWYKGTFTVTCTNSGSPLGGFWLQIDQIITP